VANTLPNLRPGFVDVLPIQEAVLQSPMTFNDIANTLGWTKTDKRVGHRVPDGGRVRKVVGLGCNASHTRSGRVYKYTNKSMSNQNARLILGAIGLDPVDVGI